MNVAVILFIDGHSSHVNLNNCELCEDRDIILNFLMQPADVRCILFLGELNGFEEMSFAFHFMVNGSILRQDKKFTLWLLNKSELSNIVRSHLQMICVFG